MGCWAGRNLQSCSCCANLKKNERYKPPKTTSNLAWCTMATNAARPLAVVVGGGAAGFFAAVRCKQLVGNAMDVLLLERGVFTIDLPLHLDLVLRIPGAHTPPKSVSEPAGSTLAPSRQMCPTHSFLCNSMIMFNATTWTDAQALSRFGRWQSREAAGAISPTTRVSRSMNYSSSTLAERR
jgi:hypothetical protein